MKTKQRFLLPLLMAIVMMAMSPMKMWADETPSLSIGNNTGITIPAGKNVKYTLTVENAGHYKFAPSKSIQGFQIYLGEDFNMGLNNYYFTAYITAGTHTLYLNHVSENEETIDLNIASYTVPALTTAGTTIASIPAGSSVWEYVYAFTAPDNGVYSFTTNNDEIIVSVFPSTPFVDPMPAFTNDGTMTCTKGSTCYVNVINDSDEDLTDVTVSVSKIPSLSVDNNTVTADYDDGTSYSFTPETTGNYTFTSEKSVYIEIYKNGDYVTGSSDYTTSYTTDSQLEANATYVIKLYGEESDTESFNLNIAKYTLPALSVGNNSVTADYYDGTSYSFTPETTDYYTFTSAKSVWIEAKSDNEYEETYSYITSYTTVSKLEAGTTYTVTLWGAESYSEAFNLNIAKSDSPGTDPLPALSVGNNSVTAKTSTTNNYTIYKFTPETSGNYTFTSERSVWTDIYKNGVYVTGTGDYTTSYTTSSQLETGTKYVLYLYGEESYDGTFNLNIAKENEGESGGETTLPALTVGTNNMTFPACDGTYIATFTPTAPGDYKFEVGPTWKNFALFAEGSSSPLAENTSTNEFTATGLVKDQTYYISMYNLSTTTGSITITKVNGEGGGSGEGDETTNALTVNDNTAHIYAYDESGTDPKYFFTFTPTESGEYTISFSDNGIEIYVFAGFGDNANSIGASEVTTLTTPTLTAETTYNLYVDGDKVEYESATITITKVNGEGGETPTYPALTVDENYVDIPGVFSFTPGETGIYRFRSEVDTYDMELDITLNGVSLMSDADGDADVDVDKRDYNFNYSISLTEGNTYLLAIKEYDDNAVEDCKIVVSYEGSGSGSSYQPVTEGKANVNEITIPADDGYKLVEFTAPATFRFQFKTIASDYNVSLFSGVPGEAGTTCLAIDLGECQYDCTMNQTYYILLSKNITMSADEQIGLSILRAHQREMSYEWGTVCLPFPINYDPNNGNYKLYMLKEVTSSQLTFLEYPEGNISQGSPMAVKAVGSKNAETQKYTINIVAGNKPIGISPSKAEIVGNYTMKGTFTEMTNQTSIYFIAHNQFWYADDAITVPAYRAYLEGPAPSNGAKAFNIVVDDETTAINNEQLTINMAGAVFNLNGQKLSAPQRGINIINGRKVLVK